ncbi:DNA-binding response regulator [Virgisporangium aurantiacum]|uniref:DNA-binding response regulator n=1 Tax=Virgisporangium aurantiacum TaxID=175570 RepID=A0A8J3ZKK2_9ACTN|nr:DNA-binding response regulator [Virgisporangium aurantiacum]
MRRGLIAMLENEHWVDSVTEASTFKEAMTAALSGAVDIIAMDVALPDGDGIEATSRIHSQRPDTRIMVLTMADDRATALRALRAGARGYLVKGTDPDVIVAALQTVAKGNYVFSASIGAALTAALHRTPLPMKPPLDKLTARELQITRLVASGRANNHIATSLGVSEKTIRNQLTAIFTKLGVNDRTQLALLAGNAGITPADTKPSGLSG